MPKQFSHLRKAFLILLCLIMVLAQSSFMVFAAGTAGTEAVGAGRDEENDPSPDSSESASKKARAGRPDKSTENVTDNAGNEENKGNKENASEGDSHTDDRSAEKTPEESAEKAPEEAAEKAPKEAAEKASEESAAKEETATETSSADAGKDADAGKEVDAEKEADAEKETAAEEETSADDASAEHVSEKASDSETGKKADDASAEHVSEKASDFETGKKADDASAEHASEKASDPAAGKKAEDASPDAGAENTAEEAAAGTDSLTEDPSEETVNTEAMLKAVTTSDFSGAQDLHVGDSIAVSIKISDPCRYFRFTPEQSGMYFFFTENCTGDPYGELYDDKAVLLAESDDIVDGVNRNFGIEYPCQAGKTYYLRARQYNYGPDSFSVSVSRQESTRPQVYRVGDRNRSFAPGEQASLSVSAHSDNPFTYVWTWDTYARSVEDGIEGANTDTFSFKVERTGVLHCTVIDDADPSLWDNCTFLISIDNGLEAWPEGNGRNDPDRTVIARAGEEITLRTMVSAADKEGLTYQWYKWAGEPPEDTDDYEETTPIEGATSAEYVVPAGAANANYACIVKDPYGGSAIAVFHTRVNHLRVYPEGGRKSETARTVTVKPGESARLAVAVDADDKTGLTYNWYRQYPSEETRIAGADKNVYQTGAVTENESIVCVVTDPYGNSGFCYFTVLFQELQVWPEGGKPGDWSIDIDVKKGETASLAVEVAPDEPGPLRYQWYDEQYEEIAGADKRSFVTPAVSRNTTYTCEVSDTYGNTESTSFLIRTNHLEAWPDNEEKGTDRTSVSVTPGESATIGVAVSADDTEGITYAWMDENYDVISGEEGASLTIPSVTAPVSRACVVSDPYGNEAWVYFDVSSNHLTAEAQADDWVGEYLAIVYVEEGGTATLRVNASSDTPSEIGYRWYDNYTGSYRYDKTENESHYTVENCTKNSQWRCMVFDPYGNKIDLYFEVRIQNHLKAYPAGTDENTQEAVVYADADGNVRLEVTTEALNMDGIRWLWYYGPEAEDGPGLAIEEPSAILQDTITEKTQYTCLVRDTYGNQKIVHFTALPEKKEEPEHVHEWDDPVFKWSKDNTSVTASRTCPLCGETETETAAVTSRVTREPACEKRGETTYTAAFKNKNFAAQKKSVEDIAPLGHDWGPWTGSPGATGALQTAAVRERTEVRTCRRCGEQQTRTIKEETGEPEEEKDTGDKDKDSGTKDDSSSGSGDRSGKPADDSPSPKPGKDTGKKSGATSPSKSGKSTSSKAGNSSASGSRNAGKTASPRTGDENRALPWITLITLSALSATALIVTRKHRKH